jgi:TonB family protein
MTALALLPLAQLLLAAPPADPQYAVQTAEKKIEQMARLLRPGCPEKDWPTGRAKVRVTVDEKGRVTEAVVIVSTADAGLDRAAKSAVELAGPFVGTPRTFDAAVWFDDERLTKRIEKKDFDDALPRVEAEAKALLTELGDAGD